MGQIVGKSRRMQRCRVRERLPAAGFKAAVYQAGCPQSRRLAREGVLPTQECRTGAISRCDYQDE